MGDDIVLIFILETVLDSNHTTFLCKQLNYWPLHPIRNH